MAPPVARMRIVSKLFGAYTRSFEQRPYLTLLVANGLLMSIGDLSAQTLGAFNDISAAPLVYDLTRTARFAVFGASMGPLAGAWNKFLEIQFPLRSMSGPEAIHMEKVKVDNPIPGMKLPKGSRLERGPNNPATMPGASQPGDVSALALGKRVAADQLGMAPISLFIFLMSMGLLEGLDEEGIKNKIKANYWGILFVNWQVWPILQLINFRYVPLKFRVPFGSLLGILWTCFLSMRTQSPAVSIVKE